MIEALAAARERYPVVAITGPRQSGKSTLARLSAPGLPVVHLEDPTELALIMNDWRGFFARYPDGAIIDEAQKLPELFSALQADVDRLPRMGKWILTGSQQFELNRGIGQSLAGRVARLTLWPFAREELIASPRCPRSLAEAVFIGGFAPLYDETRKLDPVDWLTNYVATLMEKDIADLIGVRNRLSFIRFLGLCAASTGTEITKERFSDAIGIDGKTVESWLSVLETARIAIRLAPHARRFGKRLISRQKLYLCDTGLACRLMHLHDVNQVRSCHEWGPLVETWCINELLKTRQHRGLSPDLWYWRSRDGHEVDALLDGGTRLLPIEIKGTTTASYDLAAGLRHLRTLSKRDSAVEVLPGLVIYGGDEAIPLGDDRAVPWHAIAAQPELMQ